ncbi:beta-glucosidase [Desertimonas flava]|uniref:beta-glucosidase n=1 Tax=Desertimonas flava TaxID=2064846 RepID=UPI0013C4D8BD|nr:glycoside hydrolase family 3 protein [Desertimonas flava]
MSELLRERRIALSSGADTWHTVDVPELGLPALRVSDGPNGVRGHIYDGDPSVCFPSASTLAATWDVELVRDVGRALAAECRRKGAGLLLAPTVNLPRSPLGGRNFEMFSEDPHLTSRLAVAYIAGLQRNGVGACVKHFVGNESERDRHVVSSDIDERTLRETYLRPFEAAVREAGVWAVMTAYNRLNGIPTSDHAWLIGTILRGEWGFDGLVMSDWGGTRSTVAALRAGLDLEMPGPPRRRGPLLVQAVEQGELTDDDLTAAAANVVRLIERATNAEPPDDAPSDDEIDDMLHRAAVESLVLLRNEGVLPLPQGLRVAVIGPNADPGEIQGGGSARVTPIRQISPLAGLADHPATTSVVYEPGCRIGKHCTPLAAPRIRYGEVDGACLELFDRLGCAGEPVAVRHVRSMSQHFYGTVPGLVDASRFSARLTATFRAEHDGVHRLGLASAGSARVLVDGQEVVATSSTDGAGVTLYGWGSAESVVDLALETDRTVELVVEFDRDTDSPLGGMLVGLTPPDPADLFERAVAAAAAADAAVVVVGLDGFWETEGRDRDMFELPGRQDELVRAVAARNPRTVVVVNAGSPVAMPWADDAPAILHAGYPGELFGRGVAGVIFGDASPSGKLAVTWPARLADGAAHTDHSAGPAEGEPDDGPHVVYDEGVHLGHRHFDRHGIEPLFAFGHGLGYTTFAYGEPTVAASGPGTVVIELPVANTGDRAGVEVVQLYASWPESDADRPVRQLQGFARVEVGPGATATASFTLRADELARWDPDGHRWVVDDGPITVTFGASSRDLRTSVTVAVDGASVSNQSKVTTQGEPQ